MSRRNGSPRTSMNAEIRRLQATMALLRCMQVAASEDTDADLGDALAVICDRVGESLQGLDRLESVSTMLDGSDGSRSQPGTAGANKEARNGRR